MSAAAMLAGLALDGALGWPGRLYSAIGHPVTWIGALVSLCDKRLNRGRRRHRLAAGALTVLLVTALAAAPYALAAWLLPGGLWGALLAAVLAWPLIAARSMYTHVAAVARPLTAGDLPAARAEVAMIVGRDVTRLDAAGVARAACESLAENTSDGVTAPLFWGALLGLPGIAAYKAINTMDSMIGHRSAQYEAFGKAAARLDDAVNWLPARLTGLCFALGAASGAALRVMWRDAPAHRSPNAGWPEGALAGALGVRLSGPRLYATGRVEEPWLNAGAPDPQAADVVRALALYLRVLGLLAVMLAALAWAV